MLPSRACKQVRHRPCDGMPRMAVGWSNSCGKDRSLATDLVAADIIYA
jgi:hypothetical protein